MFRRLGLLGVAVIVGGVSCANNVAQNKNTGDDGSYKKPKEMRFENDEAVAKGIVTYPGGDRADWKLLELPDKKQGTLDFKLAWTTPRPGLQLAFDVYDEWYWELSKSKASARKKKGGGGRIKTEKLENAKGKYFIRVYAVNRGDAGKYTLTATFKETPPPIILKPEDIIVPDPPRLPEVPANVVPCDDSNFDAKKPECKDFCPSSGAPKDWPPCKDTCPVPDVNDMACWKDPKKRPACPKPWDARFLQWCPAPPCPPGGDPTNPRCDPTPFNARILGNTIVDGETRINVAAGSSQGVTMKWKVTVLRGGTEQPLPGGEGVMVRVDKVMTVVKVKLTPDALKANDQVKLTPPPKLTP